MKRVVLCTVALLLTLAAIESKPAGACPMNPICSQPQCNTSCVSRGADSQNLLRCLPRLRLLILLGLVNLRRTDARWGRGLPGVSGGELARTIP